jgi:hypothetical protein
MSHSINSIDPTSSQHVIAEAIDGAAQLQELLHCPPTMIRAVGTSATGTTRHFYTGLKAQYGGNSEHIGILAIDSTDQPRLDGVGTLPPGSFVNVADLKQIQDRLRRAREDPRVASYMHEIVTRLAAGDGAGGFPAATRFFYELKEPELDAMMRQVLQPFWPGQRPAMANRANRHPLLQRWNMTVAPDGPIRVIYVASAPGGTVGALIYDVILFKYVMRQLGIEAKITLLLTLPATAPIDDVEAQRKRQLFFGRLQELTDLDAGKAVCWPLAGKVLSERNRLFDTIFIVREPAPEQLQEHQRFVGELLLELISPLGMTLFSKAVDMVPQHESKGPHGQRKLLDFLGMVTIEAAAFGDVSGYARAVLGQRAVAARTISDGATVVTNLLQRHKLTSAVLASLVPASTAMEIPQDLDGDPTGFLNYAENEARKQADTKVKQLAQDFERRCSQAIHEARDLLRRACLRAGPRSAFEVGQVLVHSLKALESTAAELSVQRTAVKPETPAEDISKRLAARLETQQGLALSEFQARAVGSLRKMSASIEHLLTALEHAASAFTELEIAYDQQHDAFLLQRLPEHTLLDRPALDDLVLKAVPACAEPVRKLAARALDSDFSVGQLKADVHDVVANHAQPFARLANVDEALRAAGERGKTVLENAVAAAEPAVRTDSQSDWRRSCVRHAYLTVSETHPLVTIVRRQARSVFSAAVGSDARRIVLITADYGVEPAALVATREALQAHTASTSDIPPFADKAYEPLADVMVPTPSEWFAYLAIPIFLCLHHNEGVIRYDELHGYVYNGQPLSKDRVMDRVTASAALLERTGRLPFLPSFEELCDQAKATLHDAARHDSSEVVKTLLAIEAVLEKHMTEVGSAEKQVLMLERAASRALRATYENMIRQRAAFVAAGYIQPAADLPTRASRIPMQEPSNDGATNHGHT